MLSSWEMETPISSMPPLALVAIIAGFVFGFVECLPLTDCNIA